jgi:hypothetical protein
MFSGFITGFLRSDKVQKFSELENEREKLRFIFEHEAYWPLSQVPEMNSQCSLRKNPKFFLNYFVLKMAHLMGMFDHFFH